MPTKQKYKIRDRFCLHFKGMVYPGGTVVELSEEEFLLCRHMVELVPPPEKVPKKAEGGAQ